MTEEKIDKIFYVKIKKLRSLKDTMKRVKGKSDPHTYVWQRTHVRNI